MGRRRRGGGGEGRKPEDEEGVSGEGVAKGKGDTAAAQRANLSNCRICAHLVSESRGGGLPLGKHRFSTSITKQNAGARGQTQTFPAGDSETYGSGGRLYCTVQFEVAGTTEYYRYRCLWVVEISIRYIRVKLLDYGR